MQTRITKTQALYSFASLYELGEYIASAPKTWKSNASVTEALSQTLGATYADAVRMAKTGWMEGASRLQGALRAFAPITPAPDTRVDFYGFRPHVPRYCAGEPDSMIRHACQRVDRNSKR